MTNLKELLAIANAAEPKAKESNVKSKELEKTDVHRTKVESVVNEADQFDDLDDFISSVATDTTNASYNTGFSDNADNFEIGDPVVGMHKGQKLAGQVVGVEGDNITVEWKDKTVTQEKASDLEMSNVDDDYLEQTTYVESVEPTMGFDKESFQNDNDFEDLLRDSMSESSPSMKYSLGDL